MNLRKTAQCTCQVAEAAMVLTVMVVAVCIVEVVGEVAASALLSPRRGGMAAGGEPATDEQKRQRRIERSAKEFLPDGTVHLVERVGRRSGDSGEEEVRIHDAADKLVWSGRRKDVPHEYLEWGARSVNPRSPGINSRQMARAHQVDPEKVSRAFVVPVIRNGTAVAERWLYEPGRERFVGTDAERKPLGYAGAQGLVRRGADAQGLGEFRYVVAWCPPAVRTPTLLWLTTGRLYQIDFDERTVTVLFDVGEQQIVNVLMSNWPQLEETDAAGRPFLGVITRQGQCRLLFRRPDRRITVDLPDGCDPYLVAVASRGGEVFLKHAGAGQRPSPPGPMLPDTWMQWSRQGRRKPRKRWIQLDRVDAEGNLARAGRFDWTVPPPSGLEAELQFDRWHAGLRRVTTAVLPPAAEAFWFAVVDPMLRRRTPDVPVPLDADVIEAAGRLVPSSRLLCWPLSLLMGLLVYLHGRRRRTSWAWLIGWCAVAVVFNLAGLLTYLALNHSSVIRCASCGRHRGLRTPHCPTCRAELALPKPTEHDKVLIRPQPA